MAFRLARPAHLIDINRVAGLDRLEVADGRLRIGARVRHAAFHRPVAAGPLGALLASVVCDIAHYPIRMRGTFCGSLAHADPAAEWGLVAVTLGAELVAISRRGERTIPASDFFQGVMETALSPDELLVEARLPLLPAAMRFGFAEFSRRPGDYALAMALAVLEIEGGVITNPLLGIGGVEACPRRLVAAEAALAGAAPSRGGIPRGGRDCRRCCRAARRSANRRAIPARAGRGDGRAGALPQGLRMTGPVEIALTVNGRDYRLRVEPRRTLLDAIRDDCGLTGTHMGCEHGVCGACTVLLDGDPVRACLIFAVQAEGSAIRTVEGLAEGGVLHALQRAFIEHHALQCGFCTPGFLMLAAGILEREPDIARRRAARCAVVEFVPLHRLSKHRRRGTRGVCRTAREPAVSGAAKPPLAGVIGRSVPRLEDPPLVTGRGQFVGDLGFPHQLHMRIVRSPYAHAVLRAVDIAAALAAPGVAAVWTGKDIADLPPIDFRDPAGEALRPYRQPLLARDRLRYVGEPVAAVFATDPYLAEDAADLVAIEAEELPPLLDAEAPPGSFAPGHFDRGAGHARRIRRCRCRIRLGARDRRRSI